MGLNVNQKVSLPQSKLRGTDEQYRLLFKNSPIPIWIFDKKTLRFLEVNKAAVLAYGYSYKEFLSMTVKDVRPKEDVPLFVSHYNKQSRKQLKDLVEKAGVWRHIKKDGTIFSVSITWSPVVFNGKQAMLTFAQDISERVELEKKKNEFIGIASHELRTPLTIIKAYTQALEKHIEESNKKTLRLFSNIDAQIERMILLIRDLLDESKIVAGTLVLRKERVDFNEAVAKIVANLQQTTYSHRIKKVGTVDKKIYADIYRIEQVIINLINNAIKYSPNADTIIVYLKESKDSLTVCVRDFGVGIAKQQQQKIFEPFVQGANERGRFSSVGLGLYISLEIIRRHEGSMWVESKKGKGSKFYFMIPISPQPQQHLLKA